MARDIRTDQDGVFVYHIGLLPNGKETSWRHTLEASDKCVECDGAPRVVGEPKHRDRTR